MSVNNAKIILQSPSSRQNSENCKKKCMSTEVTNHENAHEPHERKKTNSDSSVFHSVRKYNTLSRIETLKFEDS